MVLFAWLLVMLGPLLNLIVVPLVIFLFKTFLILINVLFTIGKYGAVIIYGWLSIIQDVSIFITFIVFYHSQLLSPLFISIIYHHKIIHVVVKMIA